jgi:hypothetical protein
VITVERTDVIALAVTDLGCSIAWYRDTFGHRRYSPPPGEAR